MNLSSSADTVASVVGDVADKLPEGGVTDIFFYAAGRICPEGESVPPAAKTLDSLLKGRFPGARVEYASDLLAAARAVCGRRRGVAAILGTGTTSCLYDGESIVANIRSGGFILGDEGGAACLGKLFISDFLKGLVPSDVADEFASGFESDYMSVVQKVYRSAAPAAYLGSFAQWILDRCDRSDYLMALVEGNFRNFIERALVRYPLDGLEVGVAGGFGYSGREILKRVAEPYGIRFSTFMKTPVEGLKFYHR